MDIDEVILEVNDLISLPDVWVRVNELVDKPGTHIDEIGDVINCDPALAAGILKLVNSSHYNFRSQITTVSRAITILGTQELKSLVLATSAAKAFNKIATDVIDVESYWWHSVFVGIAARLIAKEINCPSAEELFTSGLLHDAGKLIIYHLFPKDSQELVETCVTEDELFHKEIQRFGFSHAYVGAALFKSWNLPELIRVPIQHHHQLSRATSFKQECAAVHMANAIAHNVAPGYRIETSGSTELSEIQDEAWEWTGLDSSIVEPIISMANAECLEVLEIIAPGSSTIY